MSKFIQIILFFIPLSWANKICTCKYGYEAIGEECDKGGEHCISCDMYHHLGADNICRPNICKCDHGTPVPNYQCWAHDKQICQKNCDSGYHLLNLTPIKDRFDPNQFGYYSNPHNLSEEYIDEHNYSCVPNICTCSNGNPVTGKDCSLNHLEKCATCQTGYSLDKNKLECVNNACQSENLDENGCIQGTNVCCSGENILISLLLICIVLVV